MAWKSCSLAKADGDSQPRSVCTRRRPQLVGVAGRRLKAAPRVIELSLSALPNACSEARGQSSLIRITQIAGTSGLVEAQTQGPLVDYIPAKPEARGMVIDVAHQVERL